MILEKLYIEQTSKLIEFYKDKKNNSLKEYILTCHNYISKLRNNDIIEVYSELEYERLFRQVLCLIEESFIPDHFNSRFCTISNTLIHVLDDEFIVYILSIQKQLKKPLKWKQLIQLQYNFSILEIKFKINTKFLEDFTQYAIKNIPITELWKTSIYLVNH